MTHPSSSSGLTADSSRPVRLCSAHACRSSSVRRRDARAAPDGADLGTRLPKVGANEAWQGVSACALRKAGPADRFLDGSLQHGFMQVVSAALPCDRVEYVRVAGKSHCSSSPGRRRLFGNASTSPTLQAHRHGPALFQRPDRNRVGVANDGLRARARPDAPRSDRPPPCSAAAPRISQDCGSAPRSPSVVSTIRSGAGALNRRVGCRRAPRWSTSPRRSSRRDRTADPCACSRSRTDKDPSATGELIYIGHVRVVPDLRRRGARAALLEAVTERAFPGPRDDEHVPGHRPASRCSRSIRRGMGSPELLPSLISTPTTALSVIVIS